MMKRTIDIDMEISCKKFETALNKFFKKYPQLENDWRECFESMHEEKSDFFCDNILADGQKNNNWCYALHLDEEENYFYFAVIEREETKVA